MAGISIFNLGSSVLWILLLLLQQIPEGSSWSFSIPRRHVLWTPAAAAAVVAATTTPAAEAVVLSTDDEIQKTITGVQYRDDRIGSGPPVSNKDVLVLHLQGLTRNGNVIVDTRAQGKPILHQLGSVQDFDFFGGDSGKRPIVTMGIEDGIRGMRLGGVRRMVVPSPLGYGHAGVSRYDAMRMGLLQPVPRDEILRYEVELLQCVDVPAPDTGLVGLVAQACCTEPNYPCQTDASNGSGE